MQTGSSGMFIGWKSGQTTYVPLWDQMEGVWPGFRIQIRMDPHSNWEGKNDPPK